MATTQDHIHLGTSLGTDNAPNETYKVVLRTPQPTAFLKIARNLNGALITHVLKSGSVPVIKEGYENTLKVDMTEYTTITSLLGKQVYFVDNYHIAAGTSHTPYVKTMRLKGISNVRNLDPVLNTLIIVISLEEE